KDRPQAGIDHRESNPLHCQARPKNVCLHCTWRLFPKLTDTSPSVTFPRRPEERCNERQQRHNGNNLLCFVHSLALPNRRRILQPCRNVTRAKKPYGKSKRSPIQSQCAVKLCSGRGN